MVFAKSPNGRLVGDPALGRAGLRDPAVEPRDEVDAAEAFGSAPVDCASTRSLAVAPAYVLPGSPKRVAGDVVVDVRGEGVARRPHLGL